VAIETLDAEGIKAILAAVPALLRMPVKRFWVEYDQKHDVLYISFRRPARAAKEEILEEGVIVRKVCGEVVGLTILNASKRRA
jgi:uncharacterized protein YuzE